MMKYITVALMIFLGVSVSAQYSLEWSAPPTSDSGDIGPFGLKLSHDNDVYTYGTFNGLIDFNPNPIEEYFLEAESATSNYLLKLNENGEFIFAINLVSDELTSWVDLECDSLGNTYGIVSFLDTIDVDPGMDEVLLAPVEESVNYLLIKLSPEGELIWFRLLNGPDSWVLPFEISIGSDNEIMLNGIWSGTTDFDPGVGSDILTSTASVGTYDFFVQRFDAEGNHLWVKSFGNEEDNECVFGEFDSNGDFIFTGGFHETLDFDPGSAVYNLTSIGLADHYVVKLDGNGELLWAYSTGTEFFDYFMDVSIDQDDNIYLTGEFSAEMDFDFGPGEYVIDPMGVATMFVLKIDPEGQFVWVNTYESAQCEYNARQQTTVSEEGNLFVTGFFQGICDFDAGPGTDFREAAEFSKTSFVLELDSEGEEISLIEIEAKPTTIFNRIQGMETSNDGDVFLTIYFLSSDTIDLDPSTAEYLQGGTPGQAIAKYKKQQDQSSSINESSSLDGVTARPNPFSEYTLINVGNTLKNGAVEIFIYDNAGREVFHEDNIQNDHYLLYRNQLAPGIYFFSVKNKNNNEQIETLKLVINPF